jgi:acid phosphatase type 7
MRLKTAAGRTSLSSAAALLCVLASAGCVERSPSRPAATAPSPPATGDPRIGAAGDIACVTTSGEADECQQKATSDLLLEAKLDAVLPLGDNQYETGRLQGYLRSYDPSWGRLKSISHPVMGNHDYSLFNASDYYKYFGAAAGPPGKGYYSFDLGAWHLIALNGECNLVGGCEKGSPQERWLAADLATHKNRCVLAYWHEPRFSSGHEGGEARSDAFWRDLYAAGADVILNGHDHDYERFAPQDPDGTPDPKRGIPEFVVGTGGKNHERFGARTSRNTVVRNDQTFGVLLMTLHKDSYDWSFVPVPGSTFTDSGHSACK